MVYKTKVWFYKPYVVFFRFFSFPFFYGIFLSSFFYLFLFFSFSGPRRGFDTTVITESICYGRIYIWIKKRSIFIENNTYWIKWLMIFYNWKPAFKYGLGTYWEESCPLTVIVIISWLSIYMLFTYYYYYYHLCNIVLPLRIALSSKLRVLMPSYYGLCLKWWLKHCNLGSISFYGHDFGTCVVIPYA